MTDPSDFLKAIVAGDDFVTGAQGFDGARALAGCDLRTGRKTNRRPRGAFTEISVSHCRAYLSPDLGILRSIYSDLERLDVPARRCDDWRTSMCSDIALARSWDQVRG